MSLTPRQLIDELAGMGLEWHFNGEDCIRCAANDCPIMAYYNATNDPVHDNSQAELLAEALGMTRDHADAVIEAADDYGGKEITRYMIERLKPKAVDS